MAQAAADITSANAGMSHCATEAATVAAAVGASQRIRSVNRAAGAFAGSRHMPRTVTSVSVASHSTAVWIASTPNSLSTRAPFHG